ncbi:MAG: YbaB/EbfC family nucleoid-associated protein [Alphaproteobacteria bacterium]|jgi:nucleoid-associated protein EbfC|nr:YbaB/EbfC family nucleoid-associated protein [Alphaproteobacteria bacterium]MBT5390132.1 YbaB/EbfC family nucleoid-associated protein [Alphaproteobacteria bacterium]MBT5540140.1 YbaB/EbfC family nucleoid-associated protein [Alphaproteobacteria bacterium]MBT5655034.1 YbaB/EbfC family nucleoid-associated protein [Alphaproteobacteria bacterium]
MRDFTQMMKQAKQLQAQMEEVQKKLELLEVTGTSGAGMVEVTINGKNEAKRVKIDPSLMKADEVDMLEDLIVAAFSDAKSKVEAQSSEEMGKLTGGMKLPGGMDFPV